MKQCTEDMAIIINTYVVKEVLFSNSTSIKLCAVLHNVILQRDDFAEASFLLESADTLEKENWLLQQMADLNVFLKESFSYM